MILKGYFKYTMYYKRRFQICWSSPQYHGVTLRKCSDSLLKGSFMQLISDVACTVNIYN